MNSLAVFQQDDPQYAVSHFWDSHPAANPAVGLDFFTQWVLNGTLNPFILNHSAVGTLAGVLKVLRGLHLL